VSYYADESYDVYDETVRRARKEHRCGACDEHIVPGATYWHIATVFDGTARTYKRCERCQAIHVHLRELCRATGSDMWPDERLACGLRYEDEWGALPPEIEALAFALPNEVLAVHGQSPLEKEGVDQ
jgi:hypothetical protein